MLEATVPGSSDRDNDQVKQVPNVDSETEEYQVDNVSTSSCQEDEILTEDGEEEEEVDGAIVVAAKPRVPHFGSVSVVNSNDVHFGNKTVYKGPVTIKQFVYPNTEATKSDITQYCDKVVGEDNVINSSGVTKIDLNGVVNNGFTKDENQCNKDFQKFNGNVAPIPEQPISRIRKGFRWLQNRSNWRPRETVIILIIIVIAFTTLTTIVLTRHPLGSVPSDYISGISEEDKNSPVEYDSDLNTTLIKVRIVNRIGWLAQPPIDPIDDLKLPVPLVIIQHTATEECQSQAKCIFITRHIQQFHVESNGWNDIGYNWLVGGDGDAYEGRGWKKMGAHTFSYNNISIGFAFIGTFEDHPPPAIQISAFMKLVAQGVQMGVLPKDYKILAARQLAATASPGKAFFNLMKNWTHWSERP